MESRAYSGWRDIWLLVFLLAIVVSIVNLVRIYTTM